MLTLALDTSTNRGGIAILKDRDLLAAKSWEREKSHSELLTTFLAECAETAKIKINDIDQIAVGKGPGSFTGIRIAINASRSLGYSLKIPIFAFDTNEILAAGVPIDRKPLLTLVSAHKNLLYTAIFEPSEEGWIRKVGPEAWTLEQISKHVTTEHICVGDAYSEFKEVFPDELRKFVIRSHKFSDFPSPEALGRLVFAKNAEPLVWNEVQALYIRASEAEEKLREGQ